MHPAKSRLVAASAAMMTGRLRISLLDTSLYFRVVGVRADCTHAIGHARLIIVDN
jgi:hypothetical protein